DRAKRGLSASAQLFVRLPVSAKDRVLEVGHALPPDHGRLNLRQRPRGSRDRPGIFGYHFHLDGAADWNRDIFDRAEACPGPLDRCHAPSRDDRPGNARDGGDYAGRSRREASHPSDRRDAVEGVSDRGVRIHRPIDSLHLLPRSGNVLGDNADNVAQGRISLEGEARGNIGPELLDQLLADLLQGLRNEAFWHQAVAHGASTSSASTTSPVSVVTRKRILTLRRAP